MGRTVITAHLEHAEGEVLQLLRLIRDYALVRTHLETSDAVESAQRAADRNLLAQPVTHATDRTGRPRGKSDAWSVGSQAWRQSSAALHVGSVTHANICGPHLLTMFTSVPRSCICEPSP